MGLKDWLKGKKSNETPEPLELKQQILEALEAKITPIGGGRRIFPYPRLTIELYAPAEELRGPLQQAFIAEERLAEAVRSYLQPRCEIPRGMSVEVAFVAEPWPAWTENSFFHLTVDSVSSGPAPPQSFTAQLAVLRGLANKRKFALTKRVTFLGRLPEVTNSRGRVVQRNDLYFAEENDINHTVSRQHARIEADKGEFFLYDDDSTHGTVIFRQDGSRLEVAGRIPTPLLDNDEIRLGEACLRFNKKPL